MKYEKRVLNLSTRLFHQTVRADQTVHAVSARFCKTRHYTKVVCCVLMIQSHTRFGPVIMQKSLEKGLFGTKKGSHLSRALLWTYTLVQPVVSSNFPCCARQIPQDEALYKSRLLCADDPLPHPFWPCYYAKMS